MNTFSIPRSRKRSLFLWMLVALAAMLLSWGWTSLSDPNIDVEAEKMALGPRKKEIQVMDLNAADSLQLLELPGIGPVFAGRIVRFREMKGGFKKVEELADLYGLPPETFAGIQQYLLVDTLSEAFLTLQATGPKWGNKKWKNFQNGWKNDWKKDQPKAWVELNSADSAALREVRGLGPVLSGRIVRFRDMKGGFEQKEDLLEVYGIDEENYEQIASQVWVNAEWGEEKKTDLREDAEPEVTFEEENPKSEYFYTPKPLDLNLADSTELRMLPGIGPKLSVRIVRFREKLGFFHSTNQLNEVWGLSATNFQRMEPYLFVTPELNNFPHIRINEDDAKTLAKHPYLDWKLAKQLVNYREAHGPYQSTEDFSKLYGTENVEWEKLKPYWKF